MNGSGFGVPVQNQVMAPHLASPIRHEAPEARVGGLGMGFDDATQRGTVSRQAEEKAQLLALAPRVILGLAGAVLGIYLIAVGGAAMAYNPYTLTPPPPLTDTPAVLLVLGGALLAVGSAWLPFAKRQP